MLETRGIAVKKVPAIYPPRPAGSINPMSVRKYRGYWAQLKVNDIRITIEVGATGKISLLSRKREPLKSYSLSEAARASIGSLDLTAGKIHLLDGGLTRTPLGLLGCPVIVLWDILVHDGRYLLGTTYAERYETLREICGSPRALEKKTGLRGAYVVGRDLWLARNFTRDFGPLFEATRSTDILEGLVLKDPRRPLEWGVSEENNGAWMIRMRKANARHIF